jgi:hypothetical protein
MTNIPAELGMPADTEVVPSEPGGDEPGTVTPQAKNEGGGDTPAGPAPT